MKLRYGFSSDVVDQNIRILMDDGKTQAEAEHIAQAYADQCKNQSKHIQDDRKRAKR
jgi:pyruvate kinase